MTDHPQHDATRRPASLRLQVTAMILTALLPVFWLIGRRTAPPTQQDPLLFPGGQAPVTLQESERGLAANAPPVTLPAPAGPDGVYRLIFVPGGSRGAGQAPFRVRLETPDGRDLWQATWGGPDDDRLPVELAVPAGRLRPGRHALLVEDAAGTMRSFLFIVPEAAAAPK